MTTYGIFNDEGMVEGDFASQREADNVLIMHYGNAEDLTVSACCDDHPEYEAGTCELCNEEEE